MKRVIFYLIGLCFIALGGASVKISHIGAGSWDAAVFGLSSSLGLTPGNWIIIVGFILMLINAYLSKEKIDFLAFLTTFTIGMLIDGWLFLVFYHFNPTGLFPQLSFFILGFISIIIGGGIYLQADFAPSPVDNFMLAIQKKFNLELSRARLFCEMVGLAIAFAFSGPISIGTFVFLFGMGPCIQFSHKNMNKIYKRLG